MHKKVIVLLALALVANGVEAKTRPSRSGSGAAVAGPNGGRAAGGVQTTTGANGTVTRGGVAAADGQGNAAGVSGATAQGANGGTASRVGGFKRNADGSFTRGGAMSASGSQGQVNSQGQVTGNGQGGVAAVRQTQATSTNGGSYSGSTSASQDGVEHTGTCTNAAGEVVACH